jgi:hypothetical protein
MSECNIKAAGMTGDARKAFIADPPGSLRAIPDKVENIGGYRKEIDHALERIAAIERHLGIERKIAA